MKKIILVCLGVWLFNSYASAGLFQIAPYTKTMKSTNWSAEPMSTVVWPLQKINVNFAHQAGFKGQGTKICLIDTGVDVNHPALKGAISEYVNFTHSNSLTDQQGHGTLMATLMVGRPYRGSIGVAPEATLAVVKAFEDVSSSDDIIVQAINYCVHSANADVINMSFGALSDPSQNYKNAIEDARLHGIVLVAAAGNDARELMSPAKSNDVFSVAATNKNDQIAEFSSRGLKINFVAPGVDVPVISANGKVNIYSGTSFSSALTSASVAIAISAGKTQLHGRTIYDQNDRLEYQLIDLEKTLK